MLLPPVESGQCLVVPFSGAAGVLTPNDPQPLDASVAVAADRLAQQIMATPGRKIAVGYSAGAPVVEQAAERLSLDPNGPPADELSLITVGNLNDGLEKMVPPGTYLESIGYTVRPSTQTKYAKTVVTEPNDGLATSIPDPLSQPLAALNSLNGAANAHLGYFSSDINLSDPANVVSQDGNVSHVVLPDPTDPQAPRGPVIPAGNPTYPLSPSQVDQLIGVAAPAFATMVNGETDKLVDMLLPTLVEHPEIFDNVPLIAPQNTAVSTIAGSVAAAQPNEVAPGS